MIVRHSFFVLALAATCAGAQGVPAPDVQEPQNPHGTVLFQSHGQAPEADADRKPMVSSASVPEVPDSVRAAVVVTAYDLEAHLRPAASELRMHALVTVRNDGAVPLTVVPLQLSSTLHFEAVTLSGTTHAALPFAEHAVETDADHTGRVTEAIVTLARPLAAGSSAVLNLFYSGTLAPATDRLTRIGATATQGASADWDGAGPAGVRLRGFGNVLWYPVSSPPLFLGEGNKLFVALGRKKLGNESATARLRVSVEFAGEAPTAVWFAGRMEPLAAHSDNSADPGTNAGGIATAEFAAAPIGFRTLDLFVLPKAAKSGAAADAEASSSSSSSFADEGGLLTVYTADERPLSRLDALAEEVAPLLEEWLGPRPLRPLSLLNNAGQPFEDGSLLVAPVDALASSDAAPAMVHSLTHAWLDTGQPWIDEGFAQFLWLEWTERVLGRPAAIAKLQELVAPLALGEPMYADAAAVAAAPPGEPLISSGNEVFLRRKAAAVFFQLREIVGDAALQAAMTKLAAEPRSRASAAQQTTAFRTMLEGISHKDLAAFFNDWVLRDTGLPDLAVADVTPRPLPAGKGHDSGWLTAITVHNNGAAVAEVPVTVRAGTFSITRRMRIAGFASVTDRFLTEAQPTDVAVNDGTVVEAKSSLHTRNLVVREK